MEDKLLVKEEFDSTTLGKIVYKLFLTKHPEKDQIVKAMKKSSAEIIYCFSNFNQENFAMLSSLGFKLISIRNTYLLDVALYSPKPNKLTSSFRIYESLEAIKKLKTLEVAKIADVIYKQSRYFKDKEIKGSFAIYKNWIENTLYKNYADKVFVILDKKKPVGLISLKIKDKIGIIDLIGIIPFYQNKGLGNYLLKTGINYLLSRNLKEIMLITEGENINANILYQKNQFRIKKVELVYHAHLK